MRSIEARFMKIKELEPHLSTYTCLARAVKGQCFSSDRIRRHLNSLVDKRDYEPGDKWDLFHHLCYLTKHAEAYQIPTQKGSESDEK